MRKPSAVVIALGVLALGVAVALLQFRGGTATEVPAPTVTRPTSRTLPGPSVPTPPPRGALSLRGRVVDREGQPVAGVQVSATQALPGESLSRLPCDEESPELSLTSPDCGSESSALVLDLIAEERGGAPILARGTTAADGTFQLDALPEGTVALWALGPRGSAMEPEVATGRDDVVLALDEGLSLAGRVVAESGAPLSGTKVTLFHQAHSRYFTATTGADGRFSFGPLPDGDYGLVASSPGLMPAYVPDTAYEELDPLVLHPPRQLTGRVLLANGTPAPGAEVRVPAASLVGVTDGEGRFAFGPLAPGDYDVLAERDGQHGFASVSLSEGGPDAEATVHLGTLVFAEGVVLDEAGQPISDASVTAHSEAKAPPFGEATTGPDGRFRLGPIAPGTHTFGVDAEGYRELETQGVQVSTSPSPLSFTLQRAHVLAGIVTDTEGRPLEDIEVEAMRPAARAPRLLHHGIPIPREESAKDTGPDDDVELSGESSSVFTDEEGGFLIELPEPGRYTLTASGDSFLPARMEVDAPASGLQLRLRGGGTLEGAVTDARGKPLEQVELTVQLGPDAQGRVLETTSEERGRFTLGGLPPGTYVLHASLDMGAFVHRASRTVSVRGTETVEASLRMDTGKSVSGVVVDEQGRPMPDAEVEAYTVREQSEDDEGYSPSTAKTGPDGRFTVHHLPEGPCVLRAEKPGYIFQEPATEESPLRPGVVSRAGETDARLVLRYQGYVVGRVVHRDGTPVVRFTVNQEDFRSPDGAFRLAMERSGAFQLHFDAPGLTLAVREVDVPPGRDLDLGDVRLEPGRHVRGRVLDAQTSQPLAAVVVRVVFPGDETGMGQRESLVMETTAADGTFTLPLLEARPLELVLSREGYPHQRQHVGADDELLEVRLYPGARVEGTLTDAEGRPVDTGVMLVPLGAQDGNPVELVANGSTFSAQVSRGRFHLDALPPGDYGVHAFAKETAEGRQMEFLPQRVRLPPGGRVTVALTERAGSASLQLRLRVDAQERMQRRLSYRLVPGTVPPTTTRLELRSLVYLTIPRTGFGPDGALFYERLPSGHYTFLLLSQLKPEQSEIHREELDVSEGESLVRDVAPVWRPVAIESQP
ncbi:carboxypeptidase regulatory-like domain-containing protein [Pyxidicoccus sp. MSG2]|uniref:carboxypeptidase regulatory-like domain-containing protein n=1 Tax=Pyxidicoccus sp. MSG2 TaxID=2996790 RepID=UPI00226EE27F|nr:carboxypeptidase regulatory-like domain-containing protein [Pyxidicoccus sp. MSG2]MCY1018012.1 carboxypeptidase regulatory-like domain-containing protein [Pyxidicoccus sp. MSG2]